MCHLLPNGVRDTANISNDNVTVIVAKRRQHARSIIFILIMVLLLVLIVGVVLGAVKVTLPQLLVALGLHSHKEMVQDTETRLIIVQFRLPRILLAALVGASLATAGTVFQTLFLNPMADPYILGISSGAAFGVTLASSLPQTCSWSLNVSLIPLASFAGSICTIVLVCGLALRNGDASKKNILLSGIAVGAFFTALMSLAMYFSKNRLHQMVFWLMGGANQANWSYIYVALPYLLLGFLIVLSNARVLNALTMGEQVAEFLGINMRIAKYSLILSASLLTATAVAVSGPIGFIGLIIPHVLRIWVGPDHNYLLPASALGGAILLVLADTIARTLIAPTELPVGLVMALAGAPYFIWLLQRHSSL